MRYFRNWNFRRIERRIIVGTRFFTLIAVVGSLFGAILMFFLGFLSIFIAFSYGLQIDAESNEPYGAAAVISVIGGLDRFLIALVLLYFAYGVYSLFIHPEESEEALALPAWLRVQQIGQLKQIVAEVIIVVLFVLFLRLAMQAFSQPGAWEWEEIATLLALPTSTVLLALALRLVELHPKPARPPADRPRPEPDKSGQR